MAAGSAFQVRSNLQDFLSVNAMISYVLEPLDADFTLFAVDSSRLLVMLEYAHDLCLLVADNPCKM